MRNIQRSTTIVLIVLMIAAFALVTLTACGDSERPDEITVMLDWTPNTNHTGLYVAVKNGYYEDVGLKVKIVQATEGSTPPLIASERAEFGISYQEEVTYARSQAIPVVSIAAIIQHNTSGYASPVDRNITSSKDFEERPKPRLEFSS